MERNGEGREKAEKKGGERGGDERRGEKGGRGGEEAVGSARRDGTGRDGTAPAPRGPCGCWPRLWPPCWPRPRPQVSGTEGTRGRGAMVGSRKRGARQAGARAQGSVRRGGSGRRQPQPRRPRSGVPVPLRRPRDRGCGRKPRWKCSLRRLLCPVPLQAEGVLVPQVPGSPRQTVGTGTPGRLVLRAAPAPACFSSETKSASGSAVPCAVAEDESCSELQGAGRVGKPSSLEGNGSWICTSASAGQEAAEAGCRFIFSHCRSFPREVASDL